MAETKQKCKPSLVENGSTAMQLSSLDISYKKLSACVSYSKKKSKVLGHFPSGLEIDDFVEYLDRMCTSIIVQWQPQKPNQEAEQMFYENVSTLLRIFVNVTFLFDAAKYPQHARLPTLLLKNESLNEHIVHITITWVLEFRAKDYKVEDIGTVTNLLTLLHNYVSHEFGEEEKPFCKLFLSHAGLSTFLETTVDFVVGKIRADPALKATMQQVCVEFWNAVVNWNVVDGQRFDELRSVFVKHSKLQDLIDLMRKRIERKDEEAIYFLTLLFDDDDFVHHFLHAFDDVRARCMETLIPELISQLSLLDLSGNPLVLLLETLVSIASNEDGKLWLLKDYHRMLLDLVTLFVNKFEKLTQRARSTQENDEEDCVAQNAKKLLRLFFRLYGSLHDEGQLFLKKLMDRFSGTRGVLKLRTHLQHFQAHPLLRNNEIVNVVDEERFGLLLADLKIEMDESGLVEESDIPQFVPSSEVGKWLESVPAYRFELPFPLAFSAEFTSVIRQAISQQQKQGVQTAAAVSDVVEQVRCEQSIVGGVAHREGVEGTDNLQQSDAEEGDRERAPDREKNSSQIESFNTSVAEAAATVLTSDSRQTAVDVPASEPPRRHQSPQPMEAEDVTEDKEAARGSCELVPISDTKRDSSPESARRHQLPQPMEEEKEEDRKAARGSCELVAISDTKRDSSPARRQQSPKPMEEEDREATAPREAARGSCELVPRSNPKRDSSPDPERDHASDIREYVNGCSNPIPASEPTQIVFLDAMDVAKDRAEGGEGPDSVSSSEQAQCTFFPEKAETAEGGEKDEEGNSEPGKQMDSVVSVSDEKMDDSAAAVDKAGVHTMSDSDNQNDSLPDPQHAMQRSEERKRPRTEMSSSREKSSSPVEDIGLECAQKVAENQRARKIRKSEDVRQSGSESRKDPGSGGEMDIDDAVPITVTEDFGREDAEEEGSPLEDCDGGCEDPYRVLSPEFIDPADFESDEEIERRFLQQAGAQVSPEMDCVDAKRHHASEQCLPTQLLRLGKEPHLQLASSADLPNPSVDGAQVLEQSKADQPSLSALLDVDPKPETGVLASHRASAAAQDGTVKPSLQRAQVHGFPRDTCGGADEATPARSQQQCAQGSEKHSAKTVPTKHPGSWQARHLVTQQTSGDIQMDDRQHEASSRQLHAAIGDPSAKKILAAPNSVEAGIVRPGSGEMQGWPPGSLQGQRSGRGVSSRTHTVFGRRRDDGGHGIGPGTDFQRRTQGWPREPPAPIAPQLGRGDRRMQPSAQHFARRVSGPQQYVDRQMQTVLGQHRVPSQVLPPGPQVAVRMSSSDASRPGTGNEMGRATQASGQPSVPGQRPSIAGQSQSKKPAAFKRLLSSLHKISQAPSPLQGGSQSAPPVHQPQTAIARESAPVPVAIHQAEVAGPKEFPASQLQSSSQKPGSGPVGQQQVQVIPPKPTFQSQAQPPPVHKVSPSQAQLATSGPKSVGPLLPPKLSRQEAKLGNSMKHVRIARMISSAASQRQQPLKLPPQRAVPPSQKPSSQMQSEAVQRALVNPSAGPRSSQITAGGPASGLAPSAPQNYFWRQDGVLQPNVLPQSNKERPLQGPDNRFLQSDGPDVRSIISYPALNGPATQRHNLGTSKQAKISQGPSANLGPPKAASVSHAPSTQPLGGQSSLHVQALPRQVPSTPPLPSHGPSTHPASSRRPLNPPYRYVPAPQPSSSHGPSTHPLPSRGPLTPPSRHLPPTPPGYGPPNQPSQNHGPPNQLRSSQGPAPPPPKHASFQPQPMLAQTSHEPLMQASSEQAVPKQAPGGHTPNHPASHSGQAPSDGPAAQPPAGPSSSTQALASHAPPKEAPASRPPPVQPSFGQPGQTPVIRGPASLTPDSHGPLTQPTTSQGTESRKQSHGVLSSCAASAPVSATQELKEGNGSEQRDGRVAGDDEVAGGDEHSRVPVQVGRGTAARGGPTVFVAGPVQYPSSTQGQGRAAAPPPPPQLQQMMQSQQAARQLVSMVLAQPQQNTIVDGRQHVLAALPGGRIAPVLVAMPQGMQVAGVQAAQGGGASFVFQAQGRQASKPGSSDIIDLTVDESAGAAAPRAMVGRADGQTSQPNPSQCVHTGQTQLNQRQSHLSQPGQDGQQGSHSKP